MVEMSREFQVFVKPVGALCNLRCQYCYYLEKKSLYPDRIQYLMDNDLLEIYIKQHIQASGQNIINFSWHGGEPLLAGRDFFTNVIELQRRYKPEGSIVVNGIQTNGTLLDNDWCEFLASEGFIIGLSIDGTEVMHDLFRRTVNNEKTSHLVIQGVKLLKKYGIIPELLCVVNSENVAYPLEIYHYFKKLGAKYITFLPLVEPRPGSLTGASNNSVPPYEFGLFLSIIFDEWVEKDIGEVKIQIFEEAARTAFHQEHTLCIFKEKCGGVPVIEFNGDFYSCDHYVDNAHKLGNIRDNSLSYYLDSDTQKSFGEAKSDSLPRYCIECEVKEMCNGECPKNRFVKSPDGESGLNYLCPGYKHFFNHCRPFVNAISEAWRNQQH